MVDRTLYRSLRLVSFPIVPRFHVRAENQEAFALQHLEGGEHPVGAAATIVAWLITIPV